MSEPTCEFAREDVIRDDRWQQHASDCPDCHELQAVIDWMTSLAENTDISRDLPAPGYLLFKAQIRERLANADRVALPIQAMTAVAGLLLVALFLAESRVSSIMINALGLLASFAGLIGFAATIVLIAGAIAIYFGDDAKAFKK